MPKPPSHTFLKALALLLGGTAIGVCFAQSVPDSPTRPHPKHRTVAAASMHINEGPKVSILTTNYDGHFSPQDAVKDIPVDIHIYDIGFVVYSKQFAERFGYPDTNVADLDPGMQALEFRMTTNGGMVECHLNMLLDNNLGLDLPEQEFVNRFGRDNGMMRFPQKIRPC